MTRQNDETIEVNIITVNQVDESDVDDSPEITGNVAYNRVLWHSFVFSQKSLLTSFYQLFPRGSAEGVLKLRDTLAPSVVEEVAEDGVVGYSHLFPLLSIRHMNNFDGVREY